MDTETMQQSIVNPQASPTRQTSKGSYSNMDLTNKSKCMDSSTGVDSSAGFMKSPHASTHEGTANSGMDTETIQQSIVNPQASPTRQTSKGSYSNMDLTNLSKFMDSSTGVDSSAVTDLVTPSPIVSSTPDPIDVYAEYLRGSYLDMEMPRAIPNWPWNPPQFYTYLTILPTEQLTKAQESELTIYGCIDAISKGKKPIKLSEIFRPEREYKVKSVIFEGAPGIGKSTLAWKICKGWRNKKLFQEYRLLVLLKLRDKRIQDANDVTDLLYHFDPKVRDDFASQIRESGGQGLLLIFEGYDELPWRKRGSGSVFHRILTGLDLPHAAVIITTRPTAVSDIRLICDGKTSKYIEVLGFKDTEINEYIQANFPNDEKLRTEFQEYLKYHSHIRKMMYVPLHCAIVVEVYLSSKRSTASPPKTITHLYTQLIMVLLQRYLNNLDKREVHNYRPVVLSGYEDLQIEWIKPVHDQFLKICEKAYTGVVNPLANHIFHDLPTGFNSLGLMRSVNELYTSPTVDRSGPSSSHNFLHLTIQEYLAAFHMAQKDTHAQIADFKRFIDDNNMQTVLAFLSGLTEKKEELWDALRSVAHHPIMNATCLEWKSCIKVQVLRYLFETQNPTVYASVLGSTTVGFRYDRSASPFDFYVLGYFIAHSSSAWVLQIGYPTGTEWVEALLTGLRHNNIDSSMARGIQAFDISFCKLPHKVIKLLCDIPANFLRNLTHLIFFATSVDSNDLAELILKLPNLQRFVVWHTDLSHGGTVKTVECLVELSNLREVVIKNAKIGLEDYKALENLLTESRSIKMLDVGDNLCSCKPPHSISPLIDGLAQSKSLVAIAFPESVLTTENTNRLASALETKATLENLCISYCKMATGDTTCLIKALNTTAFRHLHSLYMAGCNIRSEGAASLAKGILAKSCALEVLDLSENSIGVDGASAIAEMLCKNTSLKELYLAKNQFEGKGAVCIAKVLKNNCKSKIEILNLSGNSIAPADEFENFADLITKCTNLHNLYLDECEIQAEGAMYIAKLLERNSTLQVVSLSGNPVGEEGAAAFAKALRSNKSLLKLWLDDKLIGTTGADTLIRSLQSNARLQVLYLHDECKPQPFHHPQQARVTFIRPYNKPCIPPFAPLFSVSTYSPQKSDREPKDLPSDLHHRTLCTRIPSKNAAVIVGGLMLSVILAYALSHWSFNPLSDSALVLDKKPTMAEFQLIRYVDGGEEKELRLTEEIADHWRKLGTRFGFNDNVLNGFHKETMGNQEDSLSKVLQMWRQGGAKNPDIAYPVSWNGFMTVLDDIRLGEVAKELKVALLNKRKVSAVN